MNDSKQARGKALMEPKLEARKALLTDKHGDVKARLLSTTAAAATGVRNLVIIAQQKAMPSALKEALLKAMATEVEALILKAASLGMVDERGMATAPEAEAERCLDAVLGEVQWLDDLLRATQVELAATPQILTPGRPH